MFVHCFTITLSNDINVDDLHNKFGNNIPEYYKINNLEYLFCVDININIKQICDDFKCIINNIYIMDINNNEYNNLYKIKFNYIINEHPYELVQYYIKK
jgi:hypothetical protein